MEEIIDGTTKEGQAQIEQMEREAAAATTSEEAYPDPE